MFEKGRVSATRRNASLTTTTLVGLGPCGQPAGPVIGELVQPVEAVAQVDVDRASLLNVIDGLVTKSRVRTLAGGVS